MMEVLVINGSPKGKNSVPPQTSCYFDIPHPEHRFLRFYAAAQNLERGRAYV